MHELWPDPTYAADIGLRLSGDQRPKPAGRPWVCLVMITSIDGAIAVDGASGDLGGPADQRRFAAARSVADMIVVGASTVSIEDYRPATTPIAVVTGSLSPDPRSRLFVDPSRPPLLYTTTQAASSRGSNFDGVAEVIDLGESIDPLGVLGDLDGRGMGVVLLEGGPTLNGQFAAADVIDEILLTVSPRIIAGDGPRLVTHPTLPFAATFGVDRVLLADDLVFLRYLRTER